MAHSRASHQVNGIFNVLITGECLSLLKYFITKYGLAVARLITLMDCLSWRVCQSDAVPSVYGSGNGQSRPGGVLGSNTRQKGKGFASVEHCRSSRNQWKILNPVPLCILCFSLRLPDHRYLSVILFVCRALTHTSRILAVFIW